MSTVIRVRELPLAQGKPLRYVTVSDMPPEIAERFMKDICPCACPNIQGEEAFYVHDFARWCRAQGAEISVEIADN